MLGIKISKFHDCKQKKAQITTLFVVVLGFVLLVTTILIDISQVSMTKASTNIAVDSGALQLGSALTSHAKRLSDEAIGGRVERTRRGGFFSGWLGQIIGWVVAVALLIVAIIVTVVTFGAGAGSWGAFFAILGLLLGSTTGSWFAADGLRQMAVLRAYASNLSLLNDERSQYQEQTLLGVVAGMVNDPVQVVDVHDVARTGRTDDWIGRFHKHYDQRIRQLLLAQYSEYDDHQFADTLRQAIEEVREDLRRLRNLVYHDDPEEKDNLRAFLKEDNRQGDPLGLWGTFLRLDEPDYETDVFSLLDERIQVARPYHQVRERVEELAVEPGYIRGKEEDPCALHELCSRFFGEAVWIWDKEDFYAQDNDLLPASPEELEDMDLSQISFTIYDIFYLPNFEQWGEDSEEWGEEFDYPPSGVGLIDHLLTFSGFEPYHLIEEKQSRIIWTGLIYDDTESGDIEEGGWWEDDGVDLDNEDDEADWADDEEGEWWADDLVRRVKLWNAFIDEWRNFFLDYILPSLGDDSDDLSAEIDAVERKLAELGLGVANQTNLISSLSSQINERNNQINSIEAEIAGLDPDEDQDFISSLDSQISSLQDEIIQLESDISASEALKELLIEEEEILLALLESLEDTKAILDFFYTDVDEARNKLRAKRNSLDTLKQRIKSNVDFIRYWAPEAMAGVGGVLYAWKDAQGWHLVQASVARSFEVPNIDSKRSRNWRRTKVRVRIRPYHRSSGQSVDIVARRFSDPVATPWWNFYPANRLDESGKADWEYIKQGLDSSSFDGGIIIAQGEPLYSRINTFLRLYGMESKATSNTRYQGRSSGRSLWRINLTKPK